jgi:hypothetical protein
MTENKNDPKSFTLGALIMASLKEVPDN